MRHSLFKLVAWSVASTGLVWQLYFICNQYFKYPITTEITIEIPGVIRPPMVNVVFANEPNRKYRDLATASDMFPPPDRVKCKVGAKMLSVSKHVSQWSGAAYSCDGGQVTVATKSLGKVSVVSVSVENKTEFDQNGAYVHFDRNMAPQEDDMLVIALKATQEVGWNEYITFEYDYVSIRKLFPPYTSCFDYAVMQIKNSKQCESKCQRDAHFERGLWHEFFFANQKTVATYPLMQIGINYKLSHNDTVREWMREQLPRECAAKCKLGAACFEEYFTAVELKRIRVNHGNSLNVRLMTSPRPMTFSVYRPAVTLVDFAVYALGTFSFWLGVAPLTLMLKFGANFEKKIRRDRLSRKVTQLQGELVELRNRMQCSLSIVART